MADREALVERLATLATTGPRYTSYPPASELRALDEAAVRAELAEIGASKRPVALYAHIPFCRSLCAYCACNVIPTRDRTRGDAYVDELITELAMLSHALGGPPRIAEIALGGGSPNFLDVGALRRLIAAVRTYGIPERTMRMSIELDPRSTTTSQLDALALLGFRSTSVGVQDFDERVQDAIRRHQTTVQTRWLIDNARNAGFDDINVDIVYGLPLQTEETFARTLESVVALGPDRNALFGYAHLPERLPRQLLVERAGRIPDAYERAELFVFATEYLTRAGYVHLGLDHFAKPTSALAVAAAKTQMVRTFQGYVERRSDVILGVGASAISSTPTMIWQNHAQLAPWSQAIAGRKLPVARGLALDRDDQIRSAVIDRLMCTGTLELERIAARFGIDADQYFAPELARLPALSELATYDAATHTLATTELGRFLVRNVCMVFDRYARSGTFSSTI